MKYLSILVPLALLTAFTAGAASTRPDPAGPAGPALTTLHCQIPCGIYGDMLRINMLMEDAATIEKGMKMVQAESDNPNQLVRWIMNKDQHAANIQAGVASYWLAQRVKAPKSGDRPGREKYLKQLEWMHAITVAAMKCKQTTDVTHVEELRRATHEFSASYFTEEELKHEH